MNGSRHVQLTFNKSTHPTIMYLSSQPAFFGPTIYVAPFLPSHFSPTIYVKLFALSSLRPTLIPYVNVACYHCPACAAMLMMSSQEVNRHKRLIIRLRNKALILSRDRLQDMETNVKHTFLKCLRRSK